MYRRHSLVFQNAYTELSACPSCSRGTADHNDFLGSDPSLPGNDHFGCSAVGRIAHPIARAASAIYKKGYSRVSIGSGLCGKSE